ncbi:MAG: hypothetical protein WBQ79_13385 [Acidobacteriaceae bacterium]
MVELVGTKDMRFLRLAYRARRDDRQMSERSNSAPPRQETRWVQAVPAVLLLWLLYQNRVRRRGTSSSDAVFDPGLGVTPENSVVNGADTSTDSRVASVALSAKKYVAPLLVKTREVDTEVQSELRIFSRELTTKISTRDASRTSRQTGCPQQDILRAAVTQVTSLPDLHRIGYTQNLPIRQ